MADGECAGAFLSPRTRDLLQVGTAALHVALWVLIVVAIAVVRCGVSPRPRAPRPDEADLL